MQSFDATVVERLDTLFSSLLEKLEMLKTTARALADYEASLEGQIRSIDTIQPNHQPYNRDSRCSESFEL